jgi:GrpB-like predicted nucleotidyltransferase (UPF0157 family)
VGVPAVVTAYDPAWPGQFEQVRARVDAALAGVAHVTEHVGSTAVPGLAAKPIIDLDVVLPDGSGRDTALRALAAGGWAHQGDQGIAGRDAFTTVPGLPYHHLYLVVAGGQAHRDHVDLRDFLRAHPDQAARYAARKQELAPLLLTDREPYLAGKAGLIADLLRQARGLGPPDPEGG